MIFLFIIKCLKDPYKCATRSVTHEIKIKYILGNNNQFFVNYTSYINKIIIIGWLSSTKLLIK